MCVLDVVVGVCVVVLCWWLGLVLRCFFCMCK